VRGGREGCREEEKGVGREGSLLMSSHTLTDLSLLPGQEGLQGYLGKWFI